MLCMLLPWHSQWWIESPFTCDLGFTLALTRLLVATGSPCWSVDGANFAAVATDATVWIWGFKTIPTRQAVFTLTTCYCNLTLTLTSYLQVRNKDTEERKKKKEKQVLWALKPFKRAKLKLQWSTRSFQKDLSTYGAAVHCPSNITVAWLTHVRWCGVRSL